MDLTAYQDVLDLPEVPDLVIMVLPTSVVLETLERCGHKGLPREVIVIGGFIENVFFEFTASEMETLFPIYTLCLMGFHRGGKIHKQLSHQNLPSLP